MNRFPRLLLIFPAWLALLFYLPSLTHGYVWDDTYFLTDMPYLRDPALWWAHIQEPLFVSRNYFRPLPLLMFVAEARIGNLNPFVFHFVNVLLHALNTLLVVLLARSLMPSLDTRARWLAGGAGLLFALHPALVENVSWISDRFDLTMVAAILLALLAERRIAGPTLRAACIALLFMTALLSKETAVLLLIILPLWQLTHWLQEGMDWAAIRKQAFARDNLLTYAGLVAALLFYFALRRAALGFFYLSDAQMAPGGGLQHLLLIGKTLGWYASLLVFPFGQTGPVHPATTPVALDDIGAWLGLVGALSLLPWLLYRVWRRSPAVTLVFCGLAALAPVSNLLPLTIADNIVHDRYLILPIAFLSLGLALTLYRQPRFMAKPALFAAAAWLCAAGVTVALTVPHWESNLSLWSWAYAREPESRIARDNYVSALINAEHNDETIAVCRRILERYPDSVSTIHNLALALARSGQYAEAEQRVLRVLGLQKRYDAKTRMDAAEAWNLLAYIHMQQQRWVEAEKALREAIQLTPYLTRPHYNLALVFYERGEWEAGDAEVAFAVRYGSPELAAAHQRLAAHKRGLAQARLNPGKAVEPQRHRVHRVKARISLNE